MGLGLGFWVKGLGLRMQGLGLFMAGLPRVMEGDHVEGARVMGYSYGIFMARVMIFIWDIHAFF